MNRFLKLSIFCSLFLSVIAFILMLATKSMILVTMDIPDIDIKGTDAIFGMNMAYSITPNRAPLAFAAWILSIVGILFTLICIVWPLLGGKVYQRYMGIQKALVAICFILAGIFIFNTMASYKSSNPSFDIDDYALGGGWIASAILFLLSGILAAIPAFFDIGMKDY